MVTINVETTLKDEEELEINITQRQWQRWQQGELIQQVMPELSDEEREFLITGIPPKEWDILFGDLED